MKKVFILLVLEITGCSLFFYREPYSTKNEAEWLNINTGEVLPLHVYSSCNELAEKILGKDKNHMTINDFNQRYSIIGKCLYGKGYRFRLKGLGITYCYNYPEICKAYSKYKY